MNHNRFSFLLAIAAGLYGCSAQHDDSAPEPAHVAVRISEEQKALAEVVTGHLERRVVTAVIACTGEIEVPPQGIASVTAPLGGYIVGTDMVPGRYVKKGAVLAKISNPEYIALQQSFLETLGQLRFAEQEYERQRLLQEQNATALKKFQESASSHDVLKARLSGLTEQLKLIGISIHGLERGNLQSEVVLRAPLTGYVTAVNHHPGQFAEAREPIFEIVDLSELHVHLNVFEKDIGYIRRDQVIRFRPSGSDGQSYHGSVSLVSPRRNEEAGTFDVHGHIDGEDGLLKPGMYVEAEILVSDDSVYAVQERSLVKSGGQTYVVVEEQEGYGVVSVDAGRRMDGWVEVSNPEPLLGKKIVTEGASRLFAAVR